MLLIPLLLLLCGCAQTEGNVSLMPEGGAASTEAPFHNASSFAPNDPAASSTNSVTESISACPGALQTQTPQSNSADPGALQTQTPQNTSADPGALPSRTPQQAPVPTPSPSLSFPQAGVPVMENLIFTALEPVGSTMYVWGGGWNEADTGAGPEALSIGCSKRWAEFAATQGSDYDYRNFRYKIHDGLDCSGYIGWILYNLFHTENSQSESDGYVMKSTLMAKTLADYGWGELIPASEAAEWKPGDICSMSGHVWLSLGMCQDGSVLLLHSSPPGVRICGTSSGDNEKTDAVLLAEEWMSLCYAEWYAKFPKCNVNDSYLTASDVMRWNSDTLKDAGQFQAMSAEETAAYFMNEPH